MRHQTNASAARFIGARLLIALFAVLVGLTAAGTLPGGPLDWRETDHGRYHYKSTPLKAHQDTCNGFIEDTPWPSSGFQATVRNTLGPTCDLRTAVLGDPPVRDVITTADDTIDAAEQGSGPERCGEGDTGVLVGDTCVPDEVEVPGVEECENQNGSGVKHPTTGQCIVPPVPDDPVGVVMNLVDGLPTSVEELCEAFPGLLPAAVCDEDVPDPGTVCEDPAAPLDVVCGLVSAPPGGVPTGQIEVQVSDVDALAGPPPVPGATAQSSHTVDLPVFETSDCAENDEDVTDESGVCTLTVPISPQSPLEYTVAVDHDAYEEGMVTGLTVARDETTAAPVSLERVTSALTVEVAGTSDAVDVTVTGVDVDYPGTTQPTDGGTAAFTVPWGTFTVSLDDGQSRNVTMAPGTPRTEPFTVGGGGVPTGTINVHVTGDEGDVEGAAVEVCLNDNPCEQTQPTPADGKVSFPGLALGTYTVTATEGDRSASQPATLAQDGEVKDVTLTFGGDPQLPRVDASVTLDGAAYSGAAVTLYLGSTSEGSCQTGGAGTCSITAIEPGRDYRILAALQNNQSAEFYPFTVEADTPSTADFDFVSPPAGGGGSGGGGGGGGGSGGGGGGGGGESAPAPSPGPSREPQAQATEAEAPELPTRTGERTERRSGSDRTETAVEVSQATFAPGVRAVYVATAGGFADALAGGPAAAQAESPVLLTNTMGLPDVTRAEIQRLRPGTIVVLGGAQAVSEEVMAELTGLAPHVRRIAGANRFVTAAATSAASFASADVAYVATGGGFADALSGGAASAHQDAPVLLTTADEAPDPTISELRRLGVAEVVVLGGEAVVSANVVAQIEAATGASVRRLSGADRYATSAAVSRAAFTQRGGVVYVATGENFPDALAGVPAAAMEDAPMLLVRRDDIPEPVQDELRRLRPGRIVILGGDNAVSRSNERDLQGYASG